METTTESDTDFGTETENLDFTTTDNPVYDSTENLEREYNLTSEVSSVQDEAYSSVFEIFLILEIIMTALELALSTVAATKIPRWRKNYRNQMLMQLSLARFIKRMIFFIGFRGKKDGIVSSTYHTILISGQIYIDFVIVILVCFFIKHMYDSLIIVIVKISKNSLYSVLCCAWLTPIPVSVSFVGIITTKVLDEWTSYLLICLIFRWPLIVLGTSLYLVVLYKVLTDKIRKFARSLTIVTFFLCLVINFYLFSKDVIYLWCLGSFTTKLISYVLGFSLNFLVLCFYIILITLNLKRQSKSCNPLPNYSTANDVNLHH